jgi:hypothetical protein
MTPLFSVISHQVTGCAAHGQGLATTKRSLCLSIGGTHKALRRCANGEIMLLIKRVRQR